MGGRGYGGGGKGRVYTYRYTVTTRMTCIKMGSDESHFNVSLIVRDKDIRPCPQITTFEEKGEPKRYRTESFRLPAYRLTARPNRLSMYTCLSLLFYGHGLNFGDGGRQHAGTCLRYVARQMKLVKCSLTLSAPF